MFNKLKIEEVIIYYSDKYISYNINFTIKHKFGTYCGFYYSFENNKNYHTYNGSTMKEEKEDGSYLEFDDKTVLFGSRYGWYTEKICDNWYFYEEDWDNLNFMKYIYDDINNMNPPSKYYQEHKEWFEKYNPRSNATASDIKK